MSDRIDEEKTIIVKKMRDQENWLLYWSNWRNENQWYEEIQEKVMCVLFNDHVMTGSVVCIYSILKPIQYSVREMMKIMTCNILIWRRKVFYMKKESIQWYIIEETMKVMVIKWYINISLLKRKWKYLKMIEIQCMYMYWKIY